MQLGDESLVHLANTKLSHPVFFKQTSFNCGWLLKIEMIFFSFHLDWLFGKHLFWNRVASQKTCTSSKCKLLNLVFLQVQCVVRAQSYTECKCRRRTSFNRGPLISSVTFWSSADNQLSSIVTCNNTDLNSHQNNADSKIALKYLRYRGPIDIVMDLVQHSIWATPGKLTHKMYPYTWTIHTKQNWSLISIVFYFRKYATWFLQLKEQGQEEGSTGLSS